MAEVAVQELPPEASAKDAFSGSVKDFLGKIGLTEEQAEEPVVETEKAAVPQVVTKEPVVEKQEEPVVEAEKPAEEAPAAEAPKPLVTQFSLFDEQGELEIPTNLIIKYKAVGKDYANPLDKVVQLAQMGHYNHEKQEQYTRTKEENAQLQSVLEEAEGMVKQYEMFFERIATDPKFYDDFVQLQQAQQTPEARALRAQQELQAERQKQAEQREVAQVGEFTNQQLVPLFILMREQYPTVTEDEILGRFGRLTAPHLVKGKIPVAKLSKVKDLVRDELAPWAQSLHVERSHEVERRNREVEAAKVAAAAAKRQVARVVAPSGSAPAAASKTKQSFKTAREWADSIGIDWQTPTT